MNNKPIMPTLEITGANVKTTPDRLLQYTQSKQYKPTNNLDITKISKEKYYQIKENNNINNKQNNKNITTTDIGNFKFDTDVNENNTFLQTHIGTMDKKYLFNQKIYDNDIIPLSEITAKN
jgi:hypothetical protein